MPEKNYYVSWVDKRTDPWPQWEQLQEQPGRFLLNGRLASFLPANHPLWPGIPLIEDTATVTVTDGRMGQFSWPGIPYMHEGQACRLYTGPTIAALFHPESRFRDLKDLERVYLLYQPDQPGSSREVLEKVLVRIGQARGIGRLKDRLRFAPIEGVVDPTDHGQIIQSIENWLRADDPFNLGGRHAAKTTTRITVNLSAGTPAMHACWLILRWNGSLGKPQCVIEYVQGDGGINRGQGSGVGSQESGVRDQESGARSQETGVGSQESSPAISLRDPLKIVPIDVLSQWIDEKKPQTTVMPPQGVLLEEVIGPPFDALRQKIDHAALLGLPILLQGERGTGKTFLARYYHDRRQSYRQQRSPRLDMKPFGADRKDKKGGERLPQKVSDNPFVTVTLSEYTDLETLRDTLFGWAKHAWNLAHEAYDGLLGEAHAGTLFLDEIHHLDRSLQASMLGPLNSRRYRPKMATYEIITDFDLVVATNDPQWRSKMADDFRDRIERIVLEVPSFRSFQRTGAEIIRTFWEFTLRRRCVECGLEYGTEGNGFSECQEQLMGVFKRHPLSGNWRDLQRLADNVLLHLTTARDGRPTALRWDREQLEHAIAATFTDL